MRRFGGSDDNRESSGCSVVILSETVEDYSTVSCSKQV